MRRSRPEDLLRSAASTPARESVWNIRGKARFFPTKRGINWVIRFRYALRNFEEMCRE
jgi:hypothetical protein